LIIDQPSALKTESKAMIEMRSTQVERITDWSMTLRATQRTVIALAEVTECFWKENRTASVRTHLHVVSSLSRPFVWRNDAHIE
jgi:hypothetical protein